MFCILEKNVYKIMQVKEKKLLLSFYLSTLIFETKIFENPNNIDP